MRITKKLLRNATFKATHMINDTFKLSDERLKAFVQAGMPGITIEENNREELLRMAMHWILDQCIPMSWHD